MKNTLQTNNFKFEIPDQNATADFQYQVVDCSTPDLSLSETSVAMPNIQNFRLPGTAVSFGGVDIDFLMDAKFEAYHNMYAWLMQICNTSGNSQHEIGTKKDALLYVLDNLGNIITIFKFYQLFPNNISPLSFTYGTSGAIDAVTCPVTFGFSYMELLDAEGNIVSSSKSV